MAYKPPFTTNDEILTLVANIAEKVGQVEAFDKLNSSPQLRKENRIRTIHSSLAIENNSLSLDQVTAVIEGKHVLAPARDVLEVQNALATYEALDSFDPDSIDSLLEAHALLMRGLTPEAGRFRSGDVGVFNGDQLIHAGTPAKYVPEVMRELFSWLATTEMHLLVISCVFHYEFEFIHPFADGNGRMGRLWQTLILSRWNSLFAWLPIESLIKENQQEYYDSLGKADASADSTGFVQFMLNVISDALDEALDSHGVSG
ncbi:Fic family protein [Anaerotardibacter muris]|uniref:Fic family protein n=1 Tax=Anaerotardibacter muris TaxID=2941505 RepID=UPI00203E12BE|nr:Fic family protein [Anaerotardibacter muris]